MRNRIGRTFLIAVAALSIASVGTAAAKQGADGPGNGGRADHPGKSEHGKGPEKKGQQYNFHGTYVGTDGLEAGQISVTVSSGNSWVRRSGLIGQAVVFDASTARIRVADVNTDGSVTLSDLVAGDSILIQARLPRTLPLTPPLKAWKLVDKTNPPAESGAGSELPG